MKRRITQTVFCLLFLFQPAYEYPIDGFTESGIRRLERLRIRVADDSLLKKIPVAGGRKLIQEIRLNYLDPFAPFRETAPQPIDFLLDFYTLPKTFVPRPPLLNLTSTADTLHSSLAIFPQKNRALQRRLKQIFSGRNEKYSIAVLDITSGRAPRYAGLREKQRYSPGSIGKLAIAAGLFTELARLYPNEIEIRKKILREHVITADEWIHTDHHRVPFYNTEDSTSAFRQIREGDRFSLLEWVDHAISPSSNAAASTVWKEAMLIRHFGKNYPPSLEAEANFFEETPKSELVKMAQAIVNDPLRKIGIAERDWRLGSFFTRTGKRKVPGSGGSYASPHGLLLFLLRLEQGRIVDEWSSLEIKRLMYMTERRIRYASAPRLKTAAVYFKSGSLYRCKEEAGFKCGKYMGNVDNYMNSVAIVERPDGAVYMVALMSNVLKINSAVEHQSIATFVDRVIE